MASRRATSNLSFGGEILLAAVSLAALAGPLVIGLVNAPLLRAQSSTADWETAAGGKMSFDVASVKQNKSGDPPVGRITTNVSLGDSDDYTPTGGLLRASNWPVEAFIGFAYKLSPSQGALLKTRLPKWASTDRFDIEAHAAGNLAKDQLRLMMQSLLADRFRLTIHFEMRQLPIFAMSLVKPGKLGPQLQPYPEGPPCNLIAAPGPPDPAAIQAMKDSGWVQPCGNLGAMFVSGRIHVGARNITINQIAGSMQGISMGTLDRPVVDRTGLSGRFNLKLDFAPPSNRPIPPSSTFQPDESGPTFLEALKEQLGLKLDSQTGPVDVVVLDHIEEPSGN